MSRGMKLFWGALSLMLSLTAGAPARAQDNAAEKPEIILYDLTPLGGLDLKDETQRRRYYDEVFLVTALQGLANRDAARLYLRCMPETDDFWLERLREPGSWLEGAQVRRIESLDALLAEFADFYEGLVLWDEAVPATSNVAATLAGLERLLPVRYDASAGSLHARLTAGSGKAARVRLSLLTPEGKSLFSGEGSIPGTDQPSTGSPKNDAYRWLLAHYGDRLNAEKIGYFVDGFWLKCWMAAPVCEHSLTNRDYFIAQGALICDLHVLPDEAPVDDPGQKPGTDLETLKLILMAANKRLAPDRMIHFAGFTPWAFKYSDSTENGWNAGGKQGPYIAEVAQTEILSAHNAYMDADAPNLMAMANASFFQHCPLPPVIRQNPRPTVEQLKKEGILDERGLIVPGNYYAHYVGDYDAAAWVWRKIPVFWSDPARGQIPLTWCINPNLAERFAFGLKWMRQAATPNDFFASGDSGAGYVNPSLLFAPRKHSELPTAIDRWASHCERYFKQWDLSVVGFIIDAMTPPMPDEGWDAYKRFAPGGVVIQKAAKPFGVRRGVPYAVMIGLTSQPDTQGDVEMDVAALRSAFQPEGHTFTVARSILLPPSHYLEMDKRLRAEPDDRAKVVDLETLLWLAAEYERRAGEYEKPAGFGQAEEVSLRPGRRAGVTLKATTDGYCARRAVPDGSGDAFEVAGNPKHKYMYLDLDDAFAASLERGVVVAVTYLDRGEGSMSLQYDAKAPGGAYAESPTRLPREGGGQWKRIEIELPDAGFQGRQNSHADLRIFCPGETALVREIVVRRR